jgi:hypothetical protein
LPGDKFPSPLFLNYAQALASSLSALSYLLSSAWRSGALKRDGLWTVLGVNTLLGAKGETRAGGRTEVLAGATAKGTAGAEQAVQANGAAGKTKEGSTVAEPTPKRSLLFLLIQVSVFQTMAGPIGFLALRHISYPTMVLGKVGSFSSPCRLISSSPPLLISPSSCTCPTPFLRRNKLANFFPSLLAYQYGWPRLTQTDPMQSCKLIPVMLLNVLLYRRKFSSHKYIVVALVTLGISLFMLLGPGGKKGGSDSAWGLALLGIK